MRLMACLLAALLSLTPGSVAALEAPEAEAAIPAAEAETARAPPPQLVAGISTGVGSSYGLLGASVDGYMLDGHLALVGGAGRWPSLDAGPGSWAFSAGVRGLIGGLRHRGYAQLSLAMLELGWMTDGTRIFDVERGYGPALTAGYHFVSGGGFTVVVGGGAGWGTLSGTVTPVVDLGFGYTLRAWWKP
jgi:hypothetical protein